MDQEGLRGVVTDADEDVDMKYSLDSHKRRNQYLNIVKVFLHFYCVYVYRHVLQLVSGMPHRSYRL